MAKSKKTGAENVRWDLSRMYKGIDDPQIDADTSALVGMYKKFSETHKGQLSQTLSRAISDYIEISSLQGKLFIYLYLLQSTDVANPAVKAKMAQAEKVISLAAGEYLTFFDIELVALSDDQLAEFYRNDEVAAKHRPWIEHQRVFKPHLLSESVEGALTKRSPFGSGAWGEFFDELEADIEIKWLGEKKTLTEMLHLLTDSKDRKQRAQILRRVNNSLKGAFGKYSAQTLYMVAGSDAIERSERSYKHPMEPANKSNQIPDEVVDALHKAVMDVAGPLTRRYYRLKAKHLGLKKLRWSDRNAPMPFSDDTIVPFNDAADIVLKAYRSFSPTLADLISDFFDQKRIDAPGIKGKRGGAFNYSMVLPGNDPTSFVFLNYLGSNRDVMTLAHELGHGGHGMLAGRAQGNLMSHAPMAYAETASVFGEMTTFNFLKQELILKGDKMSLLALLMGKIDDMINTAVRQISFSNFERRLHGMDKLYQTWNEPVKLSVEELSQIWLDVTKELYGEEGDVFTYKDHDLMWSYIGHFHRPFYVYSYAFGELLTQSLYAKRDILGSNFEPLYLDLLSSGSTRSAVDLMKPFGLDPTHESFWIDGINVGLGALVDEAEKLTLELNL